MNGIMWIVDAIISRTKAHRLTQVNQDAIFVSSFSKNEVHIMPDDGAPCVSKYISCFKLT